MARTSAGNIRANRLLARAVVNFDQTHLSRSVYTRYDHKILNLRAKDLFSMKLHSRLEYRNNEQRLQESRKERIAEAKRIERLSVILAKKASSVRAA